MRSLARGARVAAGVLLLLAGRGHAQDHVVVAAEPGTPVVAMQVLVATGPADEAPAQAGVAFLAARAVTAPLLPVLDSLGARLTVDAGKDAVAFTLLAAPDAWERAGQALFTALFRAPPDSGTVAAARRAILREMEGRAPNPADAALRVLDSARWGEGHPWARPAVGYPETVARLTVAETGRFLRTYFTAERAIVVVVGPVDAEHARSRLREFGLGRGAVPATPTDAPAPADVVHRPYDSVTTWIVASYALDPDADVAAVRLLAQQVLDEISFSPARRSVYNASARVIERVGGGELRFEMVVPPREADAWAERIGNAVAGLAERSVAEPLFQARLRRYRGERLQALATPEARAAELARGLLVRGRAEPLFDDLDSLTPDRLRAAAGALGRPVLVFLGPFQKED